MKRSLVILGVAAAALLLAADSARAQTVFDFEGEDFTFNPPAVRPGALTLLEITQDGITISISRVGGVSFDLVQNTNDQLKAGEFGQISLDPFANIDSTGFVANFSVPVSFVSLDAGDYGSDTDDFVLQAFAGLDLTGDLLDTDSFTLNPDETNFTFETASVSAPGIRSIFFNGGSDGFASSLFYDNITVIGPSAAAPEPGTFALLGLTGLVLGASRLRRR